MYDFHRDKVPSVFKRYFKSVHKTHRYNARFASKKSYYLPKIRTNYGKFNIRFVGAKNWKSVQENFKSEFRYYFNKLVTANF